MNTILIKTQIEDRITILRKYANTLIIDPTSGNSTEATEANRNAWYDTELRISELNRILDVKVTLTSDEDVSMGGFLTNFPDIETRIEIRLSWLKSYLGGFPDPTEGLDPERVALLTKERFYVMIRIDELKRLLWNWRHT
jgi:hypothetical protein